MLYPSLLFPGTTQYDNSTVPIKPVPNERLVHSLNPFNWLTVADRIRKEKADLLGFNWWHPYFSLCHFGISSLVRNEYRNKILFMLENVVSHEGSRIDSALTRMAFTHADGFLVLSDQVAKEVEPYRGARRLYRSELPIYDCYDVGGEEGGKIRAQYGLNDSHKTLLFFGYVRHYKGLDILLHALASLVRKDPSYRLLVVGEFYENVANYLSLIDELNLKEHVHLVNKFIPNEQIQHYHSVSDIVVLPYRSATQSGILSVAFGFHKPVVITAVGGLHEFVDHEKTGIIVRDPEAGALAEGIESFYRLRATVPFEENITALQSKNTFRQLPRLFEQIIADSAS